MILREIKNMYVSVFQRIEYLESTGTQYIDTEVLMDSDTAFRGTTVEFEILKISTSNFTNAVIAGAVTQNYHNYNLIVFNGKFYSDGGFVFSQNHAELNTKTTATIAKNSGDIPNLNFILFGRNIIGLPIQYIGRIRIYSCKIIKNGDIIRDFIPVRVGSVGYLYDRVSKRLFGNKGTGNFVLGQDVNSGLQQIYQNKLIGGVDYETADWLRSTGGAQIGLNYTNNGNFTLELKGKELQATGTDASQILGTTFAWNSGYLKIAIRKLTGNLMFENNSNVYSSAYQEFELKVINSSDSNYTNIIINGDTYTPLTKKYPLKLARLFYWYNGRVIQHTEGCVGHLKVDNYCNMYPCKLLRPIPRNLDAQCKERVAGECGMIDLISGKFYGNVASSGTFTVENDNE